MLIQNPSYATCPAWSYSGLGAMRNTAAGASRCYSPPGMVTNTVSPQACPGLAIRTYAHENARKVRAGAENEGRIAAFLKGMTNRKRRTPPRTLLMRCTGSGTFETSLRRWAILKKPILQGIAAGRTWRDAVRHLDLPERELSGARARSIESRIIEAVGLRTFRTTTSARVAADRLGLEFHRDELEHLIVSEEGLKALRKLPDPAEVARKWELGQQAQEQLERLAATSIGVERVRSGQTCTEVASALGLSPFNSRMLRREAATRLGAERLLSGGTGPLPPDELRLCEEHERYLREVMLPRDFHVRLASSSARQGLSFDLAPCRGKPRPLAVQRFDDVKADGRALYYDRHPPASRVAMQPVIAAVATPVRALSQMRIQGADGPAAPWRSSFLEETTSVFKIPKKDDFNLRMSLVSAMSKCERSQRDEEARSLPAVPGVTRRLLDACCRAALEEERLGALEPGPPVERVLTRLAAGTWAEDLIAQGTFPPHALDQAGVAGNSGHWHCVAAATWRCLNAEKGPGSTPIWEATRSTLEDTKIGVAVQAIEEGDSFREVVARLGLQQTAEKIVLRRTLEGKAAAAVCDGVEWREVCTNLGLPDLDPYQRGVVAEAVVVRLLQRGVPWQDVIGQLALRGLPSSWSSLQYAAACGPCVARVLEGEGWEQVADAFGLEPQARYSLQKAVVDAVLPLRPGHAWWDLSDELRLDAVGRRHLEDCVATTVGLQRVTAGEDYNTVATDLRLSGSAARSLELLVVDTLAMSRLAAGQALDEVVEVLHLAPFAQQYLMQTFDVARVARWLCAGSTPAEIAATMVEDDSDPLRRVLLDDRALWPYLPRPRPPRPIFHEPRLR